MMKLRYSPAADISFEIEAGTMKEAFQMLFDLSDVFGERKCGCCGSTDVRFFVREDKEGHHYYKMACRACPATFEFGQYKQGGGLFAKRWDKEARQPLPNGGWSIYSGGSDSPPSTSREADQRLKHQQAGQKPLTGEAELRGYREKWSEFFKGNWTLREFNDFVFANVGMCPPNEKADLWKEIQDYAATGPWEYDKESRRFVEFKANQPF